MKDPKQTSVTGRVTGHPCDVEVTSLHGIEGTEAGSPPRGVAIRLDSPAVPAFWMEVCLSREVIEGMYHWLNGGRSDLPEIK